MELRSATAADLNGVIDIDATIESHRYLHVDRAGEGLNIQWKTEERPLRDRLITNHVLDDDRRFLYRQVIAENEPGIAHVVEHDGQIVAALLVQAQADVLKVVDLRVDFDHRREGLATALIFYIVGLARENKLRAIAAESRANNDPANQLLLKLGFHLAGLDSHRYSNHDLVKEAVTLLWYAALD